MLRTLYIKNWLVGSLLFMLGICLHTSCSDEEVGGSPMTQIGEKGVTLNIALSSPTIIDPMSRAASNRTDRNRIEDFNIVLVKDNKITRIIFIDSNTSGNIGAPSETEDALMSQKLPINGTDIQYHIGKKESNKADYVFVVANYRETVGNPNSEKNLRNILTEGSSTIDDLKKLKQSTQFVSGIQIVTMFGEASLTDSDSHNGPIYSVILERTVAMFTVKMVADGLKDGVRITPTQICLHNVPTECYIAQDNAIDGQNIHSRSEGLAQQVRWGVLEGNDMALGGHENEEHALPIFMFENLKGTSANAENNQIGKNPADVLGDSEPSHYSYIEVEAEYRYMGEDGEQFGGPIAYRLWLGDNIYNDFNVKRNHYYQITLTLKGMGGLLEDGKVDKDGNFISNATDVSWRIESEGIKDAGFISNSLNISVSGNEVNIPIVQADLTKNYIIYENNNGSSWLKVQTELSGMISPTKEFPAKIFGNKDDGYYIKMYAPAYLHNQWVEDLNTLEEWLTKGFRERTLLLAEKANSNNILSTLTVRQWMPLPVLENGNTNPNEANLYYSRFDVYEGEELAWGPAEFHNVNGSEIKNHDDNGTFQGDSGNSYNSEYGFHNMVRFWKYDYDNNHYIELAGGHFDNAMTAAIYRAANSTGSDGEVTDPENTGFRYYGLASKEEWKKIREYGVHDWRFPFTATKYWTSSMDDGTQSYVFDYSTGEASLENRSNKHRARLVYHKKDQWMLY